MSIELDTIKTTRPADEVTATQFFGGNDRGNCIQLTQGRDSFLQLSRDDARAVAQFLITWAR